jgi:hypothetical protein
MGLAVRDIGLDGIHMKERNSYKMGKTSDGLGDRN